ncbi:MAG: hypothetical protein WCG47_17455 [Dermatophilaceae bacterium]
MEDVQALTENLSFVVSLDPEPLTRMEGAQALTKSRVNFVVGEKFSHGRIIHKSLLAPLRHLRSLEPSDNNILLLYRSFAFIDLTRESRFDDAGIAASGLICLRLRCPWTSPFNTLPPEPAYSPRS